MVTATANRIQLHYTHSIVWSYKGLLWLLIIKTLETEATDSEPVASPSQENKGATTELLGDLETGNNSVDNTAAKEVLWLSDPHLFHGDSCQQADCCEGQLYSEAEQIMQIISDKDFYITN